jgi:predicted ATPase/DNA-binding NarL/FixJ family response regulator
MQSLPPQLTLFIGREEETTEIRDLLANPDCRLLTLVGVGGIGKTRLAIQSGSQLTDLFLDGVYFVPLQPVPSINFVVSTIADAVNFSLTGFQEPLNQLQDYLRNKNSLIILDNFEHLFHAADLLTSILAAAPQVKFLVTSREALHLQEEWRFPVSGLDFPQPLTGSFGDEAPPKNQIDVAKYSAVQLFGERARRVRRGFSLAAEMGEVISICQLVGGMPLALELAAAWTQTVSCRAIANEIQQNLDFLATDWRNVPDRQRSMRVVFDSSWQLLTEAEQQVFARMSVFRGGFRREAAEVVTGASLAILGSLVSRSLLSWKPTARYEIHELLRQYAEEHLRSSAEGQAALYERHCLYYTGFLHKRLPDLIGGKQKEALLAIDADLDNIRAAWQYAVDMGKIEEIDRSVQAFALFYNSRSKHLEGANVFEYTLKKLGLFDSTDPRKMLTAIRFQEIAWFYIRLGRFDDAQAMQERFQVFYARLGIPPIAGAATDPLLLSSIISTIRGDYQAAVRFGKEALEHSYLHPHLVNRQYAQYVLAGATLAQGEYESARQYAEAAYATAQATQDEWFMAYSLIEMGNAACAMGDYDAARSHWKASYAIRKEFDDPEGMAIALHYLGEVALLQEQYVEAESFYEQSLELYRNLNDQGGLARTINGLGSAASSTGNYVAAWQHLNEALQIATEIQFVPLIFTILCNIGQFLFHIGTHANGVALLVQVSRHPSSTTSCKARAQQLLTQFRSVVESVVEKEVYDEAMAQTLIEDVKVLTTRVQMQMAQIQITVPVAEIQPLQNAGLPQSSSLHRFPASGLPVIQPLTGALNGALADALTAREMEVLILIVEGLSNQQIADALVITRGTVKWYTSQIYSKLGITSRTQAIARARELHITP